MISTTTTSSYKLVLTRPPIPPFSLPESHIHYLIHTTNLYHQLQLHLHTNLHNNLDYHYYYNNYAQLKTTILVDISA